jgi:hypothetical protein
MNEENPLDRRQPLTSSSMEEPPDHIQIVMNPWPERKDQIRALSIGSAVLLGLAYASVIAFTALNIAGGGDGWNSALISAVGLFLIPLASVARVVSTRRLGAVMNTAVLGFTVLADVCLIIFTIREGLTYVVKVSASAPLLVLCWAMLWLGWQLAFAISVYSKRK